MSKLPSWLEPLVPEVSEPAVISYENETYVVNDPNGNKTLFNNLEEAYDTSKSTNDVVIDESVPEYNDFFISVPCKDNNYNRVLFSFSDYDRLGVLENSYSIFLELAEKYHNNPSDFFLSYNFVTSHPAFWTRRDEEKTFDWNGDYSQNVWMSPIKGEDGNIVWMLEAGSHIEPDYTSHYHDLRLDVYAPTVEDGYIQLAALVSKFFYDDGSAKENVEYEKSELEITLEERMKELNDTEETDE